MRKISLLIAFVCLGCTQEPEFQQVNEPRAFSFPVDHGSHDSYKTEWWYFTGHLVTSNKSPFKDPTDYGFQLTFFRTSESPGTSHLMAHGALSDVRRQRFLHEQRFAFAGSGLGSYSKETFDVSTQGWKGALNDKKLELSYDIKDCSVNLGADEVPTPVLQGDEGLSKKSTVQGSASYYYSIPKINLNGTIRCKGEKDENVAGIAWMDHEFMTQGLADDKVGWDWFGLMTKEGESIMIYRLRGTTEDRDFTRGTFVKNDGTQRALSSESIKLSYSSQWISPQSGTTYPAQFKISIPSEQFSTELTPLVADQEIRSIESMNLPGYWEGAAASPDNAVLGYVELTGYERSMNKSF